ncbi:hypothetical protein [Rhizobium lentis]|uniref:hypothetical protein n=1 Tax=Rhizobium lentis TaxID=1138194 RepID=UPI001C8308BE|nr:hypothetical protein [Rhizobium lentis]MBX5000764.1 hypothetical protein [Rhizobium lentis]MBX5019193.1 hypothetical protein [Rhizobium lentis]MBX5050380.1 hypothetical protein [Rhizobium lentis]MBX5062058.1 hypothetical protein [Rhizobium lentis]MBX5145940.1 hypothetical protein [Rhizobium lentis]
MLDVIVRSALDIVGRGERLIEVARGLLDREDIDEVEMYELHYEVARLRDALFAVDEAVRSLTHVIERWPQATRAYGLQTTLH